MCPICKKNGAFIIKKGFFRGSKNKRIQRYLCKLCCKTFSDQTAHPSYRLRKWYLRQRIFSEICSAVSQREMSRKMGIHQDTIALYLGRMATIAQKRNASFCENNRSREVVFDEMETFEHTKCKPVSIVVVVDNKCRTLLSLETAQMPAKGRIAAKARRKYGPRVDKRPEALRKTMKKLVGNTELKILKSDQNPRYPYLIRKTLPKVIHVAYKGRRGCIVGQGELKEGGFDPLFNLNHTCAMIRDFIKRLTRRTWCTTKKITRLQWILELYMYFFNQ